MASLLIVVGLAGFWPSQLDAGVRPAQPLEELTQEVNRDIDTGSLQSLSQKIIKLERLEEEMAVDAKQRSAYTVRPILQKAGALSTLGRYAGAMGQREKAEKYHLRALAMARRAVASSATASVAGFVQVLGSYVDFLLQPPASLSPVQFFAKVRTQIEGVQLSEQAESVLVERSDAIYSLLPDFETSGSAEVRCNAMAGVTRALLVGNKHYHNLSVPELRGPLNDVAILKKSLEVRGIAAITVLTNAQRARMIVEMRRLVSETKCGDFVLFHFSGMDHPKLNIKSLVMPIGFDGGLVPEDAQPDGDRVIWNAEISQFLSALRNRGASVVLFLDAGTHAAAIESLQERAAKAKSWSARLMGTRVLESRVERGLTRVGRNAGDYSVFDPSGNMGSAGYEFEKKQPDGSDQPVTYGVLSYGLARVLQTQAKPTVKDVAEGLAKEIAAVAPHKGVGEQSGIVAASNSELVFLEPTRPINSDTLRIEVISPKLQEVRGAIPIQQPTFELIGRVEDSASIAQLMLDYKPISVDPIGQFKAQIELSPGQNRVTFAAFRHDMSFQTRTLEFTYDGDLARLAAVGKKYALIIGIENYDSSTVWTPLKTPRNDALAVADQLRNAYGFKTDLQLSNGQKHSLVLLDAELRSLTSTLTLMRQRLTENDSLLIYYAGHGQRLEDNKVAYWIPKDGKPDDQFTWLSAGMLISELKRMNARSVLIVSDSCFSGAMTREPADLSAFSDDRRRALLKAGTKKSRIFISSGGTEPVLDAGCRENAAHSVFACAFLTALEKADQPIFSSGELHHMYLLPLVSGRVQQQPERKEIADSGHEGGEFVFSKAEAQEAGRRIEDAIPKTK